MILCGGGAAERECECEELHIHSYGIVCEKNDERERLPPLPLPPVPPLPLHGKHDLPSFSRKEYACA